MTVFYFMPSSNKILKQAISNPEKFFLLGSVTNPIYGNTPFDQELFKDSFKDWQNRSQYSQKRQFEDVSVIQLHSNSAINMSLTIVDCGLKEYNFFNDYISSYPGMTYTYNGVEYPLTTHTFFTQFAVQGNPSLAMPEGTYYLYLQATYETQDDFFVTDYYISEPIYLAAYHPNTTYIEFKNSRNQLDTIYAAFGNSQYSIRVEGILDDLSMKAQDTQYNDQHFNFTMLNSYPYRQWKLFVGEVIGLPLWIWEKVHLALSCDTVVIDNTAVTKDESADWNKIEDNKRIWADIQIREKVNYSKLTTVNIEPLVVFIVPAYPFFDHSMQINSVPHLVGLPAYDDIDLATILDYHNITIKGIDGLLGFFSIRTTVLGVKQLVYTPDVSENIITASTNNLTKYFSIILPVVSSNTLTLNFTYKAFGAVWGDGGFEGAGDYTTTITTPIPHFYSGVGGSRTADIFHENAATITVLQINHGISSISGTIPSGLQAFQLYNSLISSFDATILAPALSVLNDLDIDDSALLSSVTGLMQPWVQLGAITFTNCVLTVSAVNQILINLNAANATYGDWADADLDISGQTPTAPPSGVGITAKTSLITTYGWNVTTD